MRQNYYDKVPERNPLDHMKVYIDKKLYFTDQRTLVISG